MKVVVDNPPMFDEIDAAFGVKGKSVFFCWGNKIYNPLGASIPPAIIAHEKVHCEQQRLHPGGIEGWWRDYIADPAFRLAQEIPAHRAELAWHMSQSDADVQVKGFRSKADYFLNQIARRLSSQLYGGLMTLSEAKKAIA